MLTLAPGRSIGCVLMILLVAACAAAQPPTAGFDFEQDADAAAWITTACGAELAITREPANVREGRGALELSWEATDGRLAMLTVDSIQADERPRSLRLSVKLAEQSPVMYGVREADGSSYQGYLYTPGGVWHDLAVDLDELMLAEGSEDENGRLDAREIDAITVADLSNLSGEAGQSLGLKQGRQRMWLDAVELSAELAPHRSDRGPDGEIIIDDFDRTPLVVLPIGGPSLSQTDGPSAEDRSALEVAFDPGGYRWVGFVHAIGYLDLTERTHIGLRLRAAQTGPLHVVMEERDGSKYIGRHKLDPARGWYEVRLPFAKFGLDPGTEDENGCLDVNQLRVIIPVLDSKRAEVGENGGSWELSRIWAE